ncbi:MAG TPA: nitroreductase family protein [Actinomycetota bacterium]|nr:nitroreductase family protein [Actinomycetota bacterium]
METATHLLHRLTSYEPGREWDEAIDDQRVVQDLVVNDLDRLPLFFKRYPDPLPRVALPRDLPSTSASAVDVLAGTADVSRTELDPPQLGRVLHLSGGVVRIMERPYGTYLFRAAGSAGGRFPLELYVAVPEGMSLPAGVHWYDPLEHALIQVGPPPQGDAAAIVVTGVPWRTGWRYRERGYRHIYWDAGTMLAQLLAAADSAGLAPSLHSRFPDAEVAALVGADGVHEFPVAVVVLGDGSPAIGATGPALEGDVDRAPVEFPLVTAAQRAGDGAALGSAWDPGPPAEVDERGADPVETVVLTRGSQRRMDPTRGLTQAVLRTSMNAALRGIDIPHFLVVHDVEGLEEGVYRWPDLAAPVRPGVLREELYRISLDQGLARDAAFVVIGATDVGALDDREYREAQLAAGLVEGRLHLLAYSLGASASGMTFLDSEIAALVGEPLDALLFTCVGVPEYTSTAGGSPGRPTTVRPMAPRL